MTAKKPSTAARRRASWERKRDGGATVGGEAAATAETELAGWGRHPVVRGHQRLSEDLEAITRGAALSRGLGRSYGDAALPSRRERTIAGTVLADRILAFDRERGIVRVEAGFPLLRLNRLSLPCGWFTPVTPGTHYVTIGGMVAADVHGKNHHVAGCFGEHVRSLRLRVADGSILECSDEAEPELFRATLGGMGLTGHILEVEFQLERMATPWIWQESEQVADFEAVLQHLEEAGAVWPFTVCWSDFLRPVAAPGAACSPRAAGQNPARRRRNRRPGAALRPCLSSSPVGCCRNGCCASATISITPSTARTCAAACVHPETFFYPLDVVRDWNRLYGRARLHPVPVRAAGATRPPPPPPLFSSCCSATAPRSFSASSRIAARRARA